MHIRTQARRNFSRAVKNKNLCAQAHSHTACYVYTLSQTPKMMVRSQVKSGYQTHLTTAMRPLQLRIFRGFRRTREPLYFLVFVVVFQGIRIRNCRAGHDVQPRDDLLDRDLDLLTVDRVLDGYAPINTPTRSPSRPSASFPLSRTHANGRRMSQLTGISLTSSMYAGT